MECATWMIEVWRDSAVDLRCQWDTKVGTIEDGDSGMYDVRVASAWEYVFGVQADGYRL